MTNCRMCGLVVCVACATTRKAIPSQGITEPARVCDRCVWRDPDGGAALKGMPGVFSQLACEAQGDGAGGAGQNPPTDSGSSADQRAVG